MRHLNIINNSNNKEKIIKEYIKRFNNFIQAAKYINTKCQNLNIVINYLDKEILTNYPHFPIHSLPLRLQYDRIRTVRRRSSRRSEGLHERTHRHHRHRAAHGAAAAAPLAGIGFGGLLRLCPGGRRGADGGVDAPSQPRRIPGDTEVIHCR